MKRFLDIFEIDYKTAESRKLKIQPQFMLHVMAENVI